LQFCHAQAHEQKKNSNPIAGRKVVVMYKKVKTLIVIIAAIKKRFVWFFYTAVVLQSYAGGDSCIDALWLLSLEPVPGVVLAAVVIVGIELEV
jgi:hypothetical protein